MDKTIYLLVSGGDYSALDFERNFNAEKVYQEMLEEGVTSRVYDTDDYYIEVSIKEFGIVDPDFEIFIKDQLCDYDQLKATNFYQVK